jgi:hypothetical protein
VQHHLWETVAWSKFLTVSSLVDKIRRELAELQKTLDEPLSGIFVGSAMMLEVRYEVENHEKRESVLWMNMRGKLFNEFRGCEHDPEWEHMKKWVAFN